jgi:quinol monooxygenase YgiN
MIVNAVTYVIRAGSEAAAIAHFEALQRETRKEPGCLGYTVHRSEDDPRTFFLFEQWRDEAALQEHYGLPHFQEHGIDGVRPLAESRTAFVGSPLFAQ